jgi:hypothetical protein
VVVCQRRLGDRRPSIVGGTLYWDSGYWVGTENNKLYAFGL